MSMCKYIVKVIISPCSRHKKGASAETPPVTGPASICNLIAMSYSIFCVNCQGKVYIIENTVLCKSKFLLGVEFNLTNKTLYNKRGATYPNGTS